MRERHSFNLATNGNAMRTSLHVMMSRQIFCFDGNDQMKMNLEEMGGFKGKLESGEFIWEKCKNIALQRINGKKHCEVSKFGDYDELNGKLILRIP